MSTLTLSSEINNVATTFFEIIDDLYADGSEITGFSATQLIVTTAFGTITINGTNFSMNGDNVYGDMDQMVYNFTNGDVLTWDDVNLTVTEMQSAFEQEENGFTNDSVENLLLNRDWTIYANDNDDILTSKTRSKDDVKIHLTGDDYFDLRGGADDLFASDGKDTVFGGAGSDTIDGGNGNDRLYGDKGDDEIKGSKGRDLLRGGTGDDDLSGGKGRDNLNGGAGNDTLDGGSGDDKLRGADGADTFVFSSAVSSGDADIIYDYELGVDFLSVDANVLEGSTIIDTAEGALLTYDDNTLLVVGVTSAQLADDVNFTFF